MKLYLVVGDIEVGQEVLAIDKQPVFASAAEAFEHVKRAAVLGVGPFDVWELEAGRRPQLIAAPMLTG